MEFGAILRQVRINSRKSIAKISRDCNIPVSSAYYALRGFEKQFIKKYTSLLDFDRLGLHGRIHIIVKVDKSCKDRFVDFLSSSMNVNSFYRLKGDYDFYVEAVFRHELDANDWVESMKKEFKLNDIIVHHILKDVQSEMFLIK